MTRRLLVLLALAAPCALVLTPAPAAAVGQCGNQKDTCKCGKNNPYPCCDNGSNCTWWAWNEACCNWNYGLPGWGNANTWASYASKHPDFIVQGTPVVGSIATSTKGKYGHVAWVIGVGNGTVTVREMNCCGTCPYGMITRTHATSYFNSGFIRPKPKGPVCGNGSCEGGENCANCSKDCGGCCGNGKCDHGETCGSCAKDCVCLPKGSLELAGSQTLRGWAKDDNSGGAVTVRLRADGKDLGDVKAKSSHPKYNGRGFAFGTPAKLCDAGKHQIEAIALDNEGKGNVNLGKRPLLCRNDADHVGPFRTERDRASALDAAAAAQPEPVLPQGAADNAPPEPVQPIAGIVHGHPQDSPYALGGQVESCLRPTIGGFDGVAYALRAAFAGLPFGAVVYVDPDAPEKVVETGGAAENRTGGAGKILCLRSEATAEGVFAKAAEVAVERPVFAASGWSVAIEPLGEGLLADLEVAQTPGLSGAVGQRGALRLWRPLLEPFDRISGLAMRQDARARATLLPQIEAAEGPDLDGAFDLQRLPARDVLAFRLARAEVGGEAFTPGAAESLLRLRELRVSRNDERLAGLFRVRHLESFGLHAVADLPQAEVKSDQEMGAVLRLGHRDAGWWSRGAVRATLQLPGPAFDRVRLHVRGHLGDPALDLIARAENGAIHLPQAPTGTGAAGIDVELALQGEALHLDLALDAERFAAAEALVSLRGIALCRGGWWTVPSPDARGLFDDRSGEDELRIVAAPTEDGETPRGGWLLERSFTTPQQAVRLKLRQELNPAALRLLVLLDGVPMSVLETAATDEREVVVTSTQGSFTRVGLLLQVKAAMGPAANGQVTFRSVEVRASKADAWVDVAAVPQAFGEALQPEDGVPLPDWATAEAADATGSRDDAGPNRDRPTSESSSAQTSGCSATGRPGPSGGWPAFGLLLLAAAALSPRRRRG